MRSLADTDQVVDAQPAVDPDGSHVARRSWDARRPRDRSQPVGEREGLAQSSSPLRWRRACKTERRRPIGAGGRSFRTIHRLQHGQTFDGYVDGGLMTHAGLESLARDDVVGDRADRSAPTPEQLSQGDDR